MNNLTNILNIIELMGMSDRSVEGELGIGKSTFYGLKKAGKDISIKNLEKFIEKYSSRFDEFGYDVVPVKDHFGSVVTYNILSKDEAAKYTEVQEDGLGKGVNSGQPDQSQSPALQRLLAVQEELRKAIEELKGGSLPPASGRAGKGKISRVRSKLKDTGNKKGTIEPG